jgi:hypothetical protein
MGSSLGEDTICLGCNMGGMNYFNDGDDSKHFSYQRSKNQLSQCIACVIVWFKVVGSCMVNGRSFTFPLNPNWNWFMSVALSHEISHVGCLNLETYVEVGHVPWWRVCNLFVDVRSLFESSKKALNFSRNVSKLFRRGDWHSKRGVTRAKVMHGNKVPMSPTWV